MIVKTDFLDKAAFLTAWGAELVKMEGKYPEFLFTLNVAPWLVWYEDKIGLVSYGKYLQQRKRLKRRGRRMSGLPEHFTGGKDVGFKLGDIAHFRYDKRMKQI